MKPEEHISPKPLDQRWFNSSDSACRPEEFLIMKPEEHISPFEDAQL